MKKKITLFVTFIITMFMLLSITGCVGNTISQEFIEQEPVVVFNSKTNVTITLTNKNQNETIKDLLKNVVEVKATQVKITLTSLKENVIESITLDSIYTKKEDSGYNTENYVEFITPETTEETGYAIDNFTGVYFKDTHAVKMNVDLSAKINNESFVMQDRFIKMTVSLLKGNKGEVNASYTFYLEAIEDTSGETPINTFKILENSTANFYIGKSTIVRVKVFHGYKLTDFTGYKLSETSELSGLNPKWYLYSKTEITNIWDYTFPKEDLDTTEKCYKFTPSQKAN